MRHYLAIERNEVLISVEIWIHLENTLLSEGTETKKATSCMVPLIGNVQKSKSIETEGWLVVSRGCRGKGRE